MNIIKVNYDNAYVKKPTEINPSFLVFKTVSENLDGSINKQVIIKIKDNLDKEPFLTDYLFNVHINKELVKSFSKQENNEIVIDNVNFLSKSSFVIKIDGYYFNEMDFVSPIVPFEREIFLFNRCAKSTICSTKTFVQSLYDAYYNEEDSLLYETYDGETFANPIEIHDNKFYRDLLTNGIYKWNADSQTYMLI